MKIRAPDRASMLQHSTTLGVILTSPLVLCTLFSLILFHNQMNFGYHLDPISKIISFYLVKKRKVPNEISQTSYLFIFAWTIVVFHCHFGNVLPGLRNGGKSIYISLRERFACNANIISVNCWNFWPGTAHARANFATCFRKKNELWLARMAFNLIITVQTYDWKISQEAACQQTLENQVSDVGRNPLKNSMRRSLSLAGRWHNWAYDSSQY